jgi:hypothetical protein
VSNFEEGVPPWETFDDMPWDEIEAQPYWKFERPRRGKEYRLQRAAIASLSDGGLSGLATYLMESEKLVMPLALRQMMIGRITVGESWGYRLVLDKHPSLARKAQKLSVKRRIEARDLQVQLYFILGDGAQKYEAGVAHVEAVMGLPRGTITTIITSEKRARAVEAFNAGLDKKRQYGAMSGTASLRDLKIEQKRDELFDLLGHTLDTSQMKQLLDEFEEHMNKSPEGQS